ncbi:hypothetical protein JOY44_03710 [Phormidium sp. CLA17]|uniref:hypothetical protein n=1 Tax=Leptolyngbya sp. Cla-17 TaxID=2803751 RepID=UPI0014916E75|nr:hypothetical protein [Leptolyngbya sp. Cla-17]MBM0740731.1 hypothetical protein [Leptolyngbya sp. Cla-17]
MPSDPYQSQVFRKLLRQTRHWLDRRQQTARRLQVAGSWSAQILVYPVYALFQSARSLGKTLGKAIQPDPISLLPAENPDEIEIPLQSAPLQLTAETALQQVLHTIERFSLPERLPIGLEPQAVRVRAVACLMETQALVLVTQFNQILDVLSPHQQHELAQRISWEIAASAQSRRPKSLLNRVIGALQGVGSWLFDNLRPAATHALPAASLPSVDAPIRQSMLAVRDCLAEVDISSYPSLLNVAATRLSAPASIFIRGVATQLDTRSLVLVTNRNEILEILDADQQTIVQQRIIWQVAHYCRYLRLRQGSAQLDPVRSPPANSPVFPGVRPFYQLMAWMQQGSVAIATNLFEEADLAELPMRLRTAPPIKFAQIRDSRRDRFTNLVTAALSPIIHQPGRSLNAELTISERKTLEMTADHSTQVTFEKVAQPLIKEPRSPDGATLPDSPLSEIIDTEVTLMGYEQSLLERIMRLLDFCFFAIEEFIRVLWNGLLKLAPKR